MVRVLQEESILEAADDVLVGDVGNGGGISKKHRV
jgi:hypothetical protein